MNTFDQFFERLIGHEAGYSSDPKDNGNWTGGRTGVGLCKGTKFGIAANTYPDLDIKNLTLDQAKAIYKRDWWDALDAEKFNPAIVYQMWDFAINSGMGTAKRELQRAVDVAADGKIGPLSIAKINSMELNDVLMRYNANRIEYMTYLSTWPVHGKGWARRVAANLRYAAVDN